MSQYIDTHNIKLSFPLSVSLCVLALLFGTSCATYLPFFVD